MNDSPHTSAAEPCSNCGTPKKGEYCFNCGQNSRNYKRSAHRIVAEVLADIFDFDSRVFHSLGYLVFRPGFLTREFIAGRRARYLSPGRLYLVMSVLFFALLSFRGGGFEGIEVTLTEDQKKEIVSGLSDEVGSDALSERLRQKALAMLENPAASYQAFIDNLPIAMFVMMPLFALLLKVFYPGSFYAQHLVFALHLHAFFFLMFCLILLTPDSGAVVVMSEAVKVPPTPAPTPAPTSVQAGASTFDTLWRLIDSSLNGVCYLYFFLALKFTYAQSVIVTGLKFLMLMFSYFVLLAIGVLGALLATLLF